MIPIKQLCKKYHFDYFRLLRWIKRGYVKAKKKEIEIKHRCRTKKIVKQKVLMWFVDEESFLEIPTFVRRNYKGRGNYKNLKKII